MVEETSFEDRIPSADEECVNAPPGTRKRAALLFDRIYLASGTAITPDIVDIPHELTFGRKEIDAQISSVSSESVYAKAMSIAMDEDAQWTHVR